MLIFSILFLFIPPRTALIIGLDIIDCAICPPIFLAFRSKAFVFSSAADIIPCSAPPKAPTPITNGAAGPNIGANMLAIIPPVAAPCKAPPAEYIAPPAPVCPAPPPCKNPAAIGAPIIAIIPKLPPNILPIFAVPLPNELF